MRKIALSTWSLLPRMGYRDTIDFGIGHRFEGTELWSNPIDFWPGAVTADGVKAIRRAVGDQRSLASARLRAGLTLLAMAIGVAAVVVLIDRIANH